jgi:hypothetical protein
MMNAIYPRADVTERAKGQALGLAAASFWRNPRRKFAWRNLSG